MTFDAFHPQGIDLRQEMAQIMEIHGHWGALRRRIDNRKAQGFDNATHEAPDMDDLASGEAYQDVFVRLRKRTLFSTGEDSTPMGEQSSPIIVFYVQSQVRPTRGDTLLELVQDETSLERGSQIQPAKPFRIFRKYDIEDVDDMREAGGRVEFFTVYTKVADLGDHGR